MAGLEVPCAASKLPLRRLGLSGPPPKGRGHPVIFACRWPKCPGNPFLKAESRADRQVTSACRLSHIVSPTEPDCCCFFQVPLTCLGARASREDFEHSLGPKTSAMMSPSV